MLREVFIGEEVDGAAGLRKGGGGPPNPSPSIPSWENSCERWSPGAGRGTRVFILKQKRGCEF